MLKALLIIFWAVEFVPFSRPPGRYASQRSGLTRIIRWGEPLRPRTVVWGPSLLTTCAERNNPPAKEKRKK